MFMAAAANPRYNPHLKMVFGGNLKIWPFAFQKDARRNRNNPPKGTMETKSESRNKNFII